MFFTFVGAIFVVFWVILCFVLFGYHYVLEVIYDLPSTGDTPCTAHEGLKLLIQRIIQEAIDLPKLTKAILQPTEDGDNKTYEDLLATAVLNKVIQNYQPENPSSSASVSSVRSPKPTKEYYFGTDRLNNKWRSSGSIQDFETASHSSAEDWVRSDSSLGGSSKFVDHLSLTIHQSIEELDASDESDARPEASPEWQSNWYLRKRRFNGTQSPVPVPMLVPNPTEDAKVLIGDREAEDTSDLSDVASDYGDTEYTPAINSILVDSKTVIGGRNLLSGMNFSDEGLGDEEDEGIEKSGGEEPTKVQVEVDVHAVNGTPFTSLESQTEQDLEYTERYATLPKTILKSPTPKPRTSVLPTENGDPFSKLVEDIREEIFEPSMKGSYSAKEKEKWKHPVHLENNPYSRENIERRLSSRSSESRSGSPYGRDYYVREAARPKGARKVKDAVDVSTNNGEIIKQLSWPPPVQFGTQQTEEYLNLRPTESDHSSLEVSISEDYETQFNQFTFDLSSDSDLSLERVYNVSTGEIVERVPQKDEETESKTQLVEEIKSPEATVVEENVFQNLVPQQIRHYEQITQCSKPEKLKEQNNEHPKKMTSTTSIDSIEDNSQNGESDENKAEETKLEELPSEPELPNIVSSPDVMNTSDPEILHLQDKHIVKNLLDEFSNMYPNLTKVGNGTKGQNMKVASKTNSGTIGLPSVQHLKKKFEESEADVNISDSNLKLDKQIYSLTARSIPRKVRQELKNQGDQNGEFPTVNGAIPTNSKEENADIPEFPKTKSAIEFFEQLNK